MPELQCSLRVKTLTNCSYNRSTAIVLGRAELSIEAREPLDTSARGKVIKRASHVDESLEADVELEKGLLRITRSRVCLG